MNYLPFSGYWFYGATSLSERVVYYCSYGLLSVASAPTTISACSMWMSPHTDMFM